MIVRWPGRIAAGGVSDRVWAFWDFLPTAAELAGTASPTGLDGRSIVPALFGEALQRQDPLYWEFHEGPTKQAVRMGRWKGVRLQPGAPLELYDLDNDIGESHNVANAHPDVVAKLGEFLSGARTESEKWPIREGRKRGGTD
jgi:arylsulfatase A-like enzyme